MKKIQLLLINIIFFGTILQAQIFVNPLASGANDGTSWTDAYTNLQDAIDVASSGSELWVNTGTYVPDRDTSGNMSPANNREKAFVVHNKELRIYGGFNAFETSITQRDLENNTSIISGDIDTPGDSLDNCYTLFYSTGTGKVTLNGFEFKYANSVSATGYYKGALTCSGLTDVEHCRFIQNTARRGGGISITSSPVVVDNCEFQGNVATEQGGGIYSEYAMTVKNSRFHRNFAGYGGALKFQFQSGGTFFVENCLIYDNGSSFGGGAIQVYFASVEVFNSTIADNITLNQNGHAFSIYQAFSFNVFNSIVWNDNTPATAAYVDNGNDVYMFENCIVSNTVNGSNIINLDPQFTNTTSSYKLTQCSPALDAGNNAFVPSSMTTDFYGKTRIQGPNVDIGAIEYEEFEIDWNGANLFFIEGNADAYQWYDCDLGQVVSGETNPQFTPGISGNYALIYTFGTCVDTTDCINVTIIGMEADFMDNMKIYPNPSKGQLTIENPENSVLKVALLSINGRILNNWEISGFSENLYFDVQKGLYLLQIENENGLIKRKKLIIE